KASRRCRLGKPEQLRLLPILFSLLVSFHCTVVKQTVSLLPSRPGIHLPYPQARSIFSLRAPDPAKKQTNSLLYATAQSVWLGPTHRDPTTHPPSLFHHSDPCSRAIPCSTSPCATTQL